MRMAPCSAGTVKRREPKGAKRSPRQTNVTRAPPAYRRRARAATGPVAAARGSAAASAAGGGCNKATPSDVGCSAMGFSDGCDGAVTTCRL